jgi:hypothetical protein
VLALAACGRSAPRVSLGPAPRLAEAKTRVRQAPPPPEWFWEPIDSDGPSGASKALDLPVAENDVRRTEGAVRVWDDLPPPARERLRQTGVLVLGSIDKSPSGADARRRHASMGAFYTHLREQRVPHLITFDALFAVVHLGVLEALGRMESVELAPALHGFLEKLDTRLTAEAAGAPSELGDAYRVARSIVSVAHALDGGTQPLPLELAAERARIEAATAFAPSALLGVRVDYTRFAPPKTAARPGAFRALAWLATAPLGLVARSERAGAPLGVAQARTNTRAAMLLARLCDREVDAGINAAYVRLLRVLSFVWGPPDDLTLVELDAIAESAGVDVTKPASIANVVFVDKVRARAGAGRAPMVDDGATGIGVRILGGHAPADSIVLHSLVGGRVGLAHEAAAKAPIDRLRKGQRVLPSALDVAGWLGAPESRGLLHETGADAFDDYERTLVALQGARSKLEQGQLHASVHGSMLDALIAWANAPRSGVAATPAADRMRVESLLAAWTLTRHAGQAMARARPRASSASNELEVSGLPVPVLVEPMPEVVTRLIGATRQLRRGLTALGSSAAPDAYPELVEIEDILRVALAGAQRQANAERASNEEDAALASLPARIAKLEDNASEEPGPVVAVIHGDPALHRVLVSATGRIEPALVLLRDPKSDDVLLAVGAHLSHHELIADAQPGTTDGSWRALLEKSPPEPASRGAWTMAFRWAR